MTIGERIKARREELNMTQDELAKKLHYKSRSSINKIELGLYNLKQSKIKMIADALQTTPSYIMGWEDNNEHVLPISVQRFPLLGNVACGDPIFADEHVETYVEATTRIKADFCLRAKGNSMINARIHDGDIVFIRKQNTVENGEIAAVLIGDEATLKRVFYYPEDSKLVLQAENPKYEPFVYVGEELNSIKILGKAVAFQSDVI
ncbi:LexA family protein [Coprococcus comes]|uniref:LexA family protein n=1 Tax=Coprococcus comes TaxID=410072 RepID=UPI0018984762|nr:S24 family peptidase [Coprococcus comes]